MSVQAAQGQDVAVSEKAARVETVARDIFDAAYGMAFACAAGDAQTIEALANLRGAIEARDVTVFRRIVMDTCLVPRAVAALHSLYVAQQERMWGATASSDDVATNITEAFALADKPDSFRHAYPVIGQWRAQTVRGEFADDLLAGAHLLSDYVWDASVTANAAAIIEAARQAQNAAGYDLKNSFRVAFDETNNTDIQAPLRALGTLWASIHYRTTAN